MVDKARKEGGGTLEACALSSKGDLKPPLMAGLHDIRRTITKCSGHAPPHTHTHKTPREIDFSPLQDGVFLLSQGKMGAQDPLRALLPRVKVHRTRRGYQPS